MNWSKRGFIKTIVALIFSGSALVAHKYCGPLIGDYAPTFTGETTEGSITFPDDYAGEWIIFFSHPSDFTPVCATEFKRLAGMVNKFKRLNTKLVGLSVDPAYVHEIWMRKLEKEMEQGGHKLQVNFPVIGDPGMRIAKTYGMIHPSESKAQTVRSVYFIDPEGIVRAIFHYPVANGRNLEEIKRLLMALQITDEKNVATPADWKPGYKTISIEKSHKDILAA
jgi:peroxiredoxin 2/4